MTKAEEINELTRLIMQVCSSCGHGKWFGGAVTCDRKKSECHSKRVRKWLARIEELEGG